MSPSDYQRRRNMALSILAENPDLARAIEEIDEEGEAMYGNAYIRGIDHIIYTMRDTLHLEAHVYEEMRSLMIAHPSMALRN